MPKKPETKAAMLGRLVRLAFVKANEGDRATAMSYWKSAVTKGYEVDPHTEKGLMIAIDRGERDRGVTKA